MGKNTVTISLERFDELRDLETAITDNHTWIIDKKEISNLYYSESISVKVMSTDEAVKEIAEKAVELKERNKKLQKDLSELKDELRAMKSSSDCDIQEIKNIKNMSVFEFLRYRRKG